MQDLNDKITGDTLTAAEFNEPMSEIQNIIEGLGQVLSGADLNQLGKAIAGYAANGSYYEDSGAADAYALAAIGLKQAPPAYADGMEISFRPDNTNTGASTVNVAGLGLKDIKTSTGADPVAGQIVASEVTLLSYDLLNDWFEILEFGGGGQYLGTAVVKAIAFNAQSIDEDITVAADQNALSAGPITIEAGRTVTIASGGVWAIV